MVNLHLPTNEDDEQYDKIFEEMHEMRALIISLKSQVDCLEATSISNVVTRESAGSVMWQR